MTFPVETWKSWNWKRTFQFCKSQNFLNFEKQRSSKMHFFKWRFGFRWKVGLCEIFARFDFRCRRRNNNQEGRNQDLIRISSSKSVLFSNSFTFVNVSKGNCGWHWPESKIMTNQLPPRKKQEVWRFHRKYFSYLLFLREEFVFGPLMKFVKAATIFW